MSLNNTDLYILVSVENKGIFCPNDIVTYCDIDKSRVYKSLKKLEEHKAIIKIERKPLRFVINYDKLK